MPTVWQAIMFYYFHTDHSAHETMKQPPQNKAHYGLPSVGHDAWICHCSRSLNVVICHVGIWFWCRKLLIEHSCNLNIEVYITQPNFWLSQISLYFNLTRSNIFSRTLTSGSIFVNVLTILGTQGCVSRFCLTLDH